MKVAIIISTLVLCYGQEAVRIPRPDDFGQSVQFNNRDILGNYQFGYDEGHPSGGSFRKEAGDAYGNKVGSYGLRDADGRIRIVNYIADDYGFRVDVRTNEPGVGLQDPASATFNKQNGIVSGSVVPVIPPVVPARSVPPPVLPVGAVNPPYFPVGVVNPSVLPVGVAPPAVPGVVKGPPLAPAPPALSFTVPALPFAPPVAKLSGPTVKYPAPALQYPIPVPTFPAVTPGIGYGKIPYPGVAPAKATVGLTRYTIPLRAGYSGSPPLPAYQVLQYSL